jgi:iron complex outermembrane receptor protein
LPASAIDAIDMNLEDLMQVSIVSAPKFAENPDRIPSVVSIITAADIRLYGWRTLGAALRSLQGFNVTDDHTYAYGGVRGISPAGRLPAAPARSDRRPGDEREHLRQRPADSAFPLDIGLIERIEGDSRPERGDLRRRCDVRRDQRGHPQRPQRRRRSPPSWAAAPTAACA